jgi:hypothetical protein
MVRVNNVGSKMSQGLNSMKQKLMSDKLNIVILVLSVILVALLVYYYVIKRKENYQNDIEIKVVLFHVSWCGYCKQLLPEWAKLDKTKLSQSNISIVEEQCDAEGNDGDIAADRHNVKEQIEGYPHIILFKGEDQIIYNGQRTHKAILEWINTNK